MFWKTSSKLKRQLLKFRQSKFKTILLSVTTFSLHSNVPLQQHDPWHQRVHIMLLYLALPRWAAISKTLLGNQIMLLGTLLLGNQMIFKDYLCYWPSQNLTATTFSISSLKTNTRYICISIYPVQNFPKKVITVNFKPWCCCDLIKDIKKIPQVDFWSILKYLLIVTLHKNQITFS